jgi:hypothetical protein
MPEPDERTGMSGGARWAIALVAAVALVVAFFALRGRDDEPETAARPSTATQEQAGAEQPAGGGEPAPKDEHTARDEETGGEPAPAEEPQGGEPAPDEEPRAEEPAVAVVRVRGGEPVGGVQQLEVRRGDRIRFRVVADADDEVHLHGYDVEKAVGPGRRATFDVEATIEGRFEVELHGTGTQIARVDVTPS